MIAVFVLAAVLLTAASLTQANEFLAAFAGYQSYRFALDHSPALLALTIVDLVVMWLIWWEYRSLKARAASARA